MTFPAHKTHIMVHCLATRPSWGKGKSISAIVKEVTNWHVRDRGWSGIAYAAIIGYSGARGAGRDLDGDGDVWDETGAGAKGWNKNTIHIALVGGYGGSADDLFEDHYTPKQKTALLKEIRAINAAAGRELTVIGHNQVANKACPCFDVQGWYASQRAKETVAPQPAPTFLQMILNLLSKFGKKPNA
jgi:hypothetical protein